MTKFVIIDGNAIIHRAYHGIPPLHLKDGQMVNAVYGFTSMLFKVWHDLKPTHLCISFDVAGGSHARQEKYDKYKATRVKADQELYNQIPLVHEMVECLGLPIYEKKGFEADDVIGTVVKEMKDKVDEIYIVTGDMDTLQLVNENTKVYTMRKGMSDIVVYNIEEVKKRFGFGPELVVDYKALRGDTSDNIPGVPGIGEKTATDLILKYGNLQEIYEVVEKESQKTKSDLFSASVLKKMVDGKESAQMSYHLATIDCAVPEMDLKLKDCELGEFDRAKVVSCFQKFEFVSLLKRLPGFKDVVEEKTAPKTKSKKILDFNFKELNNKDEVDQLVEKIKQARSFAAKAVTSSADVLTAELLGLSVMVGLDGYYIKSNLVKDFVKIFNETKVELVGHNLKQLAKVLFLQKQEIKNSLFDVMVASYLLNPGTRAHDVSSVVLKFLGKELPSGSGQESLFGVDTKAVTNELYLITQTVADLKEELVKTDNLGLLQNLEMPLMLVLAEVELNGVALDLELLKKLSDQVNNEIKRVSKKIFDLAGMEFNISSPTQLREVLFEKLEIPVDGIKKGKTGLSTDSQQLEKMRDLHPIINEIEIYREITKLQNTYIDVLPTLVNKKTGRIHTNYNQVVAATGRLSSVDPNLQNIPIRTELGREIRKAFVAAEGNVLLSADYSQIELRIVASLAKDEKMMEIFEKDLDIHKATAAAINGVKLEEVTKEMRRAAKEVNFGVLYGMGTYGLSWRAEIPHWQAKEFIQKYFEQFSGVKKYLDQTIVFTKKEGYCETLFGRRRYIPELNSQNFQLRSAAERMAINHPIQGTAADLIKMAMIAVQPQLKDLDAKMILQVHDELVFEIKKGQEEKVGKIVKEAMEGVVKLSVPVRVDLNFGKSWGEMK
ncbi:MAG: DNA polymerase I [Candidatus Magasanikbacteria bacterium]|nr:DNA polymerase I [Candidatus Magasanikbacteria bacterium]